MKISAFCGLALALMGIALGLYLDGGHAKQLLQPTAALIVLGGTLGAVLVQFPLNVCMQAAYMLRQVFFGVTNPAPDLILAMSRYAQHARRNGIVSLDAELSSIHDPFFKRCLTLAVDGVHPEELRFVMEAAIDNEAAQDAMLARVFESAGGFAPTVGILGAVIGLIQVMQKMQNISEVGQGIAVAFVATIYGVGLANLLLLPCAGRIRILVERRSALREMTLEGVIGIMHHANPRALEQRLAILAREQVQPLSKVMAR